MKFGVQHPSFSNDGSAGEIAESLRKVSTTAERFGYDSFWVMDHFHQIPTVGQEQEPMLEGWTTLGAIAGYTSRIKLGTMVTGNIYRHPSILAKVGATFDVLSKGRLFMGIGAGWNESESKAYGISFPSTRERFRRLEEAVQIIRKMWTEEQANFNGQFYKIQNAYCNPKPIQKPYPPILIGGSGERETLKLVAKYADACNLFGSPETVKRKLEVLREHCKTVGRDYSTILKTRLGVVIVDKDKAALDKRIAKRFRNVSPERRTEFAVVGTPEEIKRQVQAFKDIGLEYFITSFEWGRELDGMEQFANDIMKTF
ncbi:MAG TPA: LLM class F420-dependent oxidoreductase [Candidatus Acidoferrales bacterium]|nr:LLM class F420-dependent oxidoreductase [Candidatus Acidoferrales bacterium]